MARAEGWPWCAPARYNRGLREGKPASRRRAIRYLSEELEQVHVIGKYCRSLRLQWIAGFGMALALLPAAHATAGFTTSTTLTAQSSTQSCPTSTSANPMTTTLTTLTVTVTSSGGVPSGTVNITDQTSPTATPVEIASVTLNASGQATVSLYLSGGPHTLAAGYAGSIPYGTSTSMPVSATVSSQCDTQFAVSVSNITPSSTSAMTLTPGESGTATVTVTPSQEYVDSLSTSGAPAFVTVSCSGLPSLSSCALSPEDLEILPGQDAGVISTLLIQTESGIVRAVPPAGLGHRSSPVAWADSAAWHAGPGRIGVGSAAAPLAAAAFIGFAGGTGGHSGNHGLQSAPQLLHPRSKQPDRDAHGHVYRDHHRAVEQRSHRRNQ